MKKIITTFVFLFCLLAKSQELENLYVIIDSNNKLIVKEGRFYKIFSDTIYLNEFKRRRNYKFNDSVSSSENTNNRNDFSSKILNTSNLTDCLSGTFGIQTSGKKEISDLEYKKLNVINLKKLGESFTKYRTMYKINFIEKLGDKNYLIEHVIPLDCE